jgi:nucleotide-binding universal stress UspA family protein
MHGRRLLVATDFSDACAEIVARSAEIARAWDATIDLVHVREPLADLILEGAGPTPEHRAAIIETADDSLARAAEQICHAGVACSTTSLRGSATRAILAHAHRTRPDLIILGSRGHGGLLHIFVGSVTERVTRRAPCPVLVIPVRGAAAPTAEPVAA